jgi:aspartyl-tRNA(Asn)/glutamyl-tRNA(Gln) amidotransferase subunit B
MAYEAVIGLECHIQLRTASKMFCSCPAEFGAKPNSNVCPVCLGLPGALPIANRAAVEATLRLGLSLGCDVREHSVFARKNYFYPDMPKNYQITQYDLPLCEGGELPVAIDGAMRPFALTRIHLEEDTGKSFHPERIGDRRVSRVDFNRAGVPLLELVTQPVFRQASECAAFLTGLRRLARWLGISDADMEKGHLRCDANVSLREEGATAFGTKTEIKNLNSIKAVEKGIHAELARQRDVLESGGRIEQATLLYDADHDKLAVMRSKEQAHDYRYFPEPDLPPLRVPKDWSARIRASLPELPWTREARLKAEHALSAYEAELVTSDRNVSSLFDKMVGRGIPAKAAANFIINDAFRQANEQNLTMIEWERKVPLDKAIQVINAVATGVVTAATGRGILDEVFLHGADPSTLFVEKKAMSSSQELLPLVREVLDANPGPVAQYLGGKTATLGFLVGQVMKKSGGQAVPQTVQDLLRAELDRRANTPA